MPEAASPDVVNASMASEGQTARAERIAPAWVVPVMRAGYFARAVVYGLIGYFAVRAAWIGGHAEGVEGALVQVMDETLGIPLLWAVAAGAFCFALWCLLAAAMDLDARGTSLGGLYARIDFAATGLIYIVIAVFVGELAHRGYGSGGEGEGREQGTAWLLSLPAGGWIVIAIGAGFVAAGLWFAYKAFAGRYRERLRDTPMVEWLDPLCKFGWTANGIVVVILGGFLVWAGWTLDASKAGGFAEAFAIVRQAAFGRVLLLILGLGFVAFAVECCVEAVYRIVPARHGTDYPTLAMARAAMPRSGGAAADDRPDAPRRGR
jgi:Domain of Unknown Function (DUF1206)